MCVPGEQMKSLIYKTESTPKFLKYLTWKSAHIDQFSKQGVKQIELKI